MRGLGRVDMSYAEFEASAAGAGRSAAEALARHVYRVGALKKKFHPFVAPLAGRAKILHFTGEMKPWRIDAAAAAAWRTHGAALTPTGHVVGDCALDADARLMRREVFACPTARGCGHARFANYTSTTAIFSSGCFARFALCATATLGAEACASVWHAYVDDKARAFVDSDDARRRRGR